jgi:MoxR-like ATPase
MSDRDDQQQPEQQEPIEPWFKFHGDGRSPTFEPPAPPPWRQFQQEGKSDHGGKFVPPPNSLKIINAAIYLRRPLLVTGKPGTGKTSLAYAIARELKLDLLRWNIGTRSILQDALYRYDAIARVQDRQDKKKGEETPVEDIGRYMRLGPLGTAIWSQPGKPRVLLVDEIDKSDIDLPNDLLHVLEEGKFEIQELQRIEGLRGKSVAIGTALDADNKAEIIDGKVTCREFPIVIMTSNGERDFPPAFLRRCLRLEMEQPERERLCRIVVGYLGGDEAEIDSRYGKVLDAFLKLRDREFLATDQLLNAIYLVAQGQVSQDDLLETLQAQLFKPLDKS